MERLKEAFANLGIAAVEAMAALGEFFNKIYDAIKPAAIIAFAPKSKIKHLALHGKKARTRKKNYKRLLKELAERSGGNA